MESSRYYYLEVDPAPSNSAYSTRVYKQKNSKMGSYRFLQNTFRNWKSSVKSLLKLHDLANPIPLESIKTKFVELEIWCCWDAEYFYQRLKNRVKLSRRDVTGHTKLLEDSIAEYIGIDDTYNLNVILHKRLAYQNSILIRLTFLPDDYDLSEISI